jgi:hypothetical protein
MARLLWTQRHHTGPRARVGHSMVFDETRAQVVLTGGTNSPETWVWDGASWVQVADMGPVSKLWDKMRALEALAKHFGLVTERLEVSGWDKLSAQLNHARTVGPTRRHDDPLRSVAFGTLLFSRRCAASAKRATWRRRSSKTVSFSRS